MLIWLRYPKRANAAKLAQAGIGIEGEVIPAAALGRLLELEDGFAALAGEREQGQRELEEKAKEAYENAYKKGYAEGQAQAVEEWYERALAAMSDYQQIRLRMRERLAGLVISAVEQIVQTEDTKTLFVRALSTLDQIVEGASSLAVSVNPSQLEAAQQTFEKFVSKLGQLGRPIKLIVRSDRRLALGACICESDFGIVDASLDIQLQALRAAIERALTTDIAQAPHAVASEVNVDEEAFDEQQLEEEEFNENQEELDDEDLDEEDPDEEDSDEEDSDEEDSDEEDSDEEDSDEEDSDEEDPNKEGLDEKDPDKVSSEKVSTKPHPPSAG
ncbi:type III secretion system stator protein SctL [Mycoavidus sp. B2-EB]|uniref:type III secretion system stator protein SctL n=1 Tax=Mycoavidus sp. B2-EB TaxID=2651972 RepID=UPI00162810E9|nr:type III secretion system stator protein SctL [Mycoavidus sp. B2-EB]BBO60052.1 type III secretion system protein HrpB [Mycoavidus sp. B2-EB]